MRQRLRVVADLFGELRVTGVLRLPLPTAPDRDQDDDPEQDRPSGLHRGPRQDAQEEPAYHQGRPDQPADQVSYLQASRSKTRSYSC